MKTKLKKYNGLVSSIGTLLSEARQRVVREVNQTIIFTYWHIGRYIVEYEQGGAERAEYGTGLLKHLSQDLTKSFGKGYSYRNLQRIKKFYQAFPIVPSPMAQFKGQNWPAPTAKSSNAKLQTPSAQLENQKVPSAMAQLTWTHFVRLLSVRDEDERNFYLIETAENNWSVRELDRQINSSLFERLTTTHLTSLAKRGKKAPFLFPRERDGDRVKEQTLSLRGAERQSNPHALRDCFIVRPSLLVMTKMFVFRTS